MASLMLVRNVVGELQPKRTLAASRGFLAAARLSCIFSRRYLVYSRAYATARLSVVCRCRLSVCTECIVSKRCVLEQKLLLTPYRKSHMRNRLVPKWITLTFV